MLFGRAVGACGEVVALFVSAKVVLELVETAAVESVPPRLAVVEFCREVVGVVVTADGEVVELPVRALLAVVTAKDSVLRMEVVVGEDVGLLTTSKVVGKVVEEPGSAGVEMHSGQICNSVSVPLAPSGSWKSSTS